MQRFSELMLTQMKNVAFLLGFHIEKRIVFFEILKTNAYICNVLS